MTLLATNPAPGEVAPAAEVETDEEFAATETDLETEGEEGDESAQAEPEETEEVEHEGKKYKIPKPLKGALLMQADYTRKTQEVAEQRKQVEAERARFAEEQKLITESISEFGKVQALNDALAQYDKVDWATLFQSNRQLYDQLRFNQDQAKLEREKAVTALQGKVQERNSKAQQETAKRLEEARAAVQRDIPDWSPELAGKLNQFAMMQGFTAQELSQVSDPRVIKLLHAAYVGSQAKVKAAAAARAKPAEDVQPLKTVSGSVPAERGLSDKLSVEEWTKRRNAQLKRKQGR
jgi:hypothetical protein